MSRDYAKKSRPAPAARNSNKKKPAAKRTAPAKSAPKRGAPAWVWLLTGTALGAFIMFLAFLAGLTPAGKASDNPQAKASNSANDAPTVPKPRFDFYKILKEEEVVVAPSSSAIVPKPSTTASSKNQSKSNSADDGQEFILQVGSFKNADDADSMRAQLILLNLQAQVEKVTVRNGETWNRVLVGPFDTHKQVDDARSTLLSNNINPLLLKRKRS